MELSYEFTDLRLFPVCADFTQDIDLPLTVESQRGNKVIFFPGSTIGNLHPHEATIFLKKLSKLVGTNGQLLIGVDLKKDPTILESAYNDSSGVTASFNLNLLTRLNREANANFQLNNFQHEAIYNQKLGRVEMHLRSKIPQLVRVNRTIFRFREGETIHTECSYKYTVEEFCEFAAKARFVIKKFWLDEKNQFAVYYFSRG
jgi:dimethylhistidine N-methyltransferase